MKRGMVLGKFMPPHAGHVALCEFAQSSCDELAIVVGSLAREPIPGALRFAWMKELFPRAHVVHLTDENPQYPHEHPRFWEIWEASLRRVLPWPLDVVFAAEDYGGPLAKVLGASFVPLDRNTGIPISGTAIREDPLAHWEHIPPCVRPYFTKRISIFGPESTGKTTLAQKLAERFATVVVPEYARTHLERTKPERVTADDIDAIVRGQIASERALERSANRILFSDTDVLATVLWSETLVGSCPDWIRQAARERTYDLTLLCDADVPWEADPVRYLPNEGRAFFTRCEAILKGHGRAFTVVRGSWDERLAIAIAAVQAATRLP